MTEESKYNSVVDRQTRLRIQLAMAAYAYEIEDKPIMEDGDFDKLCLEVDLSIDTRRPDLDAWFREEFHPSTGCWIHHHPDLQKIGWLVNAKRNGKEK